MLFSWQTNGPIIDTEKFGQDDWIAMKDPSIVRHGGRWHLFCTLRGHRRLHAIVYSSFADFEDAATAAPIVLPNHSGYNCAPQVFYFRPQKKWYMVCQASDDRWQPKYQAAYATTTDIADPSSWSKLEPMHVPRTKDKLNLDFWLICDDAKAHLFFTSDNGKMWRVETGISEFPLGWRNLELAMQTDIFEASHIYRMDDGRYVNLVEAQHDRDIRYFKAFVADKLDGSWSPIAAEWTNSYASMNNVRQVDEMWTNSISHGELIRDENDERMRGNLDSPFVFQGVLQKDRRGKPYGKIPWKLGLLRRVRP